MTACLEHQKGRAGKGVPDRGAEGNQRPSFCQSLLGKVCVWGGHFHLFYVKKLYNNKKYIITNPF